MANNKYLNLYASNHGKLDGIEDYISLITKLMSDRGLPVKVSSTLDPSAINLIIDEFTNYVENHRIAAFKEANPDSRIVIVLTEFIVRKWGVESFNHFGDVFDAAAIALFDVYLRVIRDDFDRVNSGQLLRLLCFSPLLILQALLYTVRFMLGHLVGRSTSNPIARYLRAHHRIIYFHMRYLGLKTCLRYANAVVTSHEKIIDEFSSNTGFDGKPLQYLGVLYPEIDEGDVLSGLMVGKKLFIEITGSVTRYRQKWIQRLNHRLVSLGLHNVFGYCVEFPFSLLKSSKYKERGAYSLHPPQNRLWPYCSPTRIFRALSVDHNLPILTHHFHQNPIEDVCFVLESDKSIVHLYEMYSDPVLLRQFIEPRIKTYNRIVTIRNNDLAKKMLGMMNKVM